MRHLLPAPSVARAEMAAQAASGRATVAGDRAARRAPRTIRERVKAFVAELARPAEGGVEPHPGRQRLPRAALAEAVGPRRVADRAAGDRRGAARRRGSGGPHLQVGAWVLPDAHRPRDRPTSRSAGSRPSMRGEITWCQMFSEPERRERPGRRCAPRATKVDGGWSITGQKVWTTMATRGRLGHLPGPHRPRRAEARRHRLLPASTWRPPGIDVRPLRELTGMAMFNEVFLTDVFVPDECVVGPADRRVGGGPHDAGQRAGVDGGRARRSARARSRCSTSPKQQDLLRRPRSSSTASAGCWSRPTPLAALAIRTHAAGARRRPARSRGERPQADRRGARAGGAGGRARPARPRGGRSTDGEGVAWTGGFLGNRALSIAGGTSEIQRNLIAERLLGLPKDP